MNFGTLIVEGATLAATPDANPRARSFRPFVTTADGGVLVMRGARVAGLGFGETLKFSGLSVMRSLLRPAPRPVRIEGTLIEDVLTLGIAGDAGAVVAGNRFRDMRGAALVVSRAEGVTVSGNLFAGRQPTNAVRLEGGARGVVVAGNVILGGTRAGIVVRGGSPAARVAGNVVWGREGGGVLVNGAPCATVEGNLVIGNAQKGIEFRRAPHGHVAGNSVLSNDSTGIWVADQPEGAGTRIERNAVAFNTAGLAGARGGRLVLSGNDLSRQFLQFLAGDLTPQAAVLARDMRGAAPLVLTAAGTAPATPADLAPDPACAAAP
jgi:poly(beta-D-mannuronate) C5 epimerase